MMYEELMSNAPCGDSQPPPSLAAVAFVLGLLTLIIAAFFYFDKDRAPRSAPSQPVETHSIMETPK